MKMNEYYASYAMPAVLVISGSRMIEKKLKQSESTYDRKDGYSVFYSQLESITSEAEKIIFTNQSNLSIRLKKVTSRGDSPEDLSGECA